LKFKLVPAPSVPQKLSEPLEWSLKLWGENKPEFSADDWHEFYRNVQLSNYDFWDQTIENKELLYLAINEEDEVIAAIGLCDFDDLEEFRHLKPWVCAFVVREDLRGSGIGSKVLAELEKKVIEFKINDIYLWTEEQKDFYIKRGYQEIDQLLKPGRTLHIMKKKI
jgi:N-acetylglutamate synthase-like GNAT family acetyltransferase